MKRRPFSCLQVLVRTFLLTCTLTVLASSAYSQTVYVTNTGAKYHATGCQYLSKSKIAVQIDSAIIKSYTACSVCKPKISSSSKQGIAEHSSSAEPASTTQCVALTKAGNRCLRITKEPGGRCWQHQ